MLRKLLAVCCPKRPRRFRKAFAEQAAEVGRIIKTDQLRDMADIKLCMQKQRAGLVKPQSQQVGFEYVNTFIRVFKSFEGISPGVYKETLLKKELDADPR